MSNGINKVILVGNVGKIESRSTQTGDTIVSVSLATSSKWRDKSSGQYVEQTEWHNVTLFKQLAEIAAKYVTKGSKLYIEGSLKTDKWKDKDGNERYTTKIIARDMQMLGDRPISEEPKPKGDYKKAKEEPAYPFDDEIPF